MFPEFSVHKTVPLKFAGADLRLKTSHALFSSHRVDDGTMLLLKTLAQRKVLPETGRVLDAGCGVGPLALAIKKAKPGLTVTARDRLVLAAQYTAENARINGLEVDAAPGLLLDQTPGPWDLIVSNLPAKAGAPVLGDFVRRSLALLAPGGLVAVVIVEPLATWLGTELGAAGARTVYRETAPGYEVFHYGVSSPSSVPNGPFPDAYRRGEVAWKTGDSRFLQRTFFGLPNFDGLDFRLQATLPLLKGLKPDGDVLVWEPVQGHLATWARSVLPGGGALHVAGNDVLGLAAAAGNGGEPVLHPAAFFQDLNLPPVSGALVQFHPEPEVPWAEASCEALRRLVRPGGWALVNGSSTDLNRLLEYRSGLRIIRDERTKGWRAVLLIRKTG
jgi:SAM-dependent methyltransferase